MPATALGERCSRLSVPAAPGGGGVSDRTWRTLRSILYASRTRRQRCQRPHLASAALDVVCRPHLAAEVSATAFAERCFRLSTPAALGGSGVCDRTWQTLRSSWCASRTRRQRCLLPHLVNAACGCPRQPHLAAVGSATALGKRCFRCCVPAALGGGGASDRTWWTLLSILCASRTWRQRCQRPHLANAALDFVCQPH